MRDIVAGLIKSADPEIAKSLIFADALLSSILTDPTAAKSVYLRSRTLARLLFTKIPELDAITYPGVALTGAFNMAFKVEAARRLLKPNGSCVVRVDSKYDFGLFDVTLVRKASGNNNADGSFLWMDSESA